jgi:hypothetical protein
MWYRYVCLCARHEGMWESVCIALIILKLGIDGGDKWCTPTALPEWAQLGGASESI